MAAPRCGQVTVSGTAQALSSSAVPTEEYVVKAKSTNVGPVYLGPSTVTTANGHFLEAGESIGLVVDISSGQPKFEVRPHELYVVGTAGDKVSWFG